MKAKLVNEVPATIDYFSNKYQIIARDNIKQKVTDEITKWKRSVAKKLHIQNPFYDNQKALENAKNTIKNNEFSILSIEKDLQDFTSLSSIAPINIDNKFWNKEIENLKILDTFQNKDKSEKKNRKIRRRLGNDAKICRKLLLQQWEKELNQEYIRWELEVIEKYRKELLQKLEKWLELVQKVDDLFNDLSIDTGLLFDLSKGQLSLNDIGQLKKWVEYISKDKGVKELCDMLGRLRNAEESSRKEIIKTMFYVTEYVPDVNSNEEIVGIKIGRDIEHALPQELALMGDTETSILFDMKYIEGRLMCFDMMGMQERSLEIKKEKVIEVAEKEKLGPIIICVDTSGSMSGSPETIAKAVTLYMATRAIKQKRNCFLINFSTGIETLDLSDGLGIVKVIEFLRKSFNGGTDVGPALNYALELMKKENYKKSDLLIISDFIMSSLSNTITTKIENAKIEKNKFYSLVIGNMFLSDKLRGVFDDEWIYNPVNRSVTQIQNVVNKMQDNRYETPIKY